MNYLGVSKFSLSNFEEGSISQRDFSKILSIPYN